MIRMIFLMVPLALALAGCGDKAPVDDGKQPEAETEDAHAHAAKHGGELLELGAHDGFLEAKMDHAAGTVTVWATLGEEMKDTKFAEAPVLNLKAGGKPKQLTATAQDDGSWIFSDAALKEEIEGARFRVVVGGQTYSPEWAHAHSHEGHDHDAHDGDEHEGHDHDGEEHEGHDHDGEDSDG